MRQYDRKGSVFTQGLDFDDYQGQPRKNSQGPCPACQILGIIPSSNYPFPITLVPITLTLPFSIFPFHFPYYPFVYQYTVYKCPVYQYTVHLSTLLPITKGISTHYQGYMCPLQRVYVPSIIVYWYTARMGAAPWGGSPAQSVRPDPW